MTPADTTTEVVPTGTTGTDAASPVKKKYKETKTVVTTGGFSYAQVKQTFERVITGDGDTVPEASYPSATIEQVSDDTPAYAWKEI